MEIDASGLPVYNITDNVNAAISTAADLVRNTPPYNLNGSGWVLGIWDGGGLRATHQEFGGRVTVKDGALPIDHATHVGGTISAADVGTDRHPRTDVHALHRSPGGLVECIPVGNRDIGIRSSDRHHLPGCLGNHHPVKPAHPCVEWVTGSLPTIPFDRTLNARSAEDRPCSEALALGG
jgi:hypothetical protein